MILNLKTKCGDYLVYARTDIEKDIAYLHLFRLMNSWGFYNETLDGDQSLWHASAFRGNARSAKYLLKYRSDNGYEYETIEEIYPVIP